MNIQEQIKADLKQAMLNKNNEVKSILRVVIGEFNRVGKDVTDEKATALIKKMVQNAKDQENVEEQVILESYLPTQLSEAELTDLIQDIIIRDGYTTMKDMGQIMGSLKANHAGLYDGKVASTLVRKLLS